MPFQTGDAQCIASTVWGTAPSFTPEPTKAKLREGPRKAWKKTWEKAKKVIRGELTEDGESALESQRSSIVQQRESNTETDEETYHLPDDQMGGTKHP